jgi:hypothetical protein
MSELSSASQMTKVQENFLKHIQESKRIIFSAPFGIGKSFFIEEFFKLPQVKSEYEPFTIHPVHYCTSDNKSIFEIIKYDLVFQLVRKQIASPEYRYEWDHSIFSKNVKEFAVSCANTVLNGLFGQSLDVLDKVKTFMQLCKEFAEHTPEIVKEDGNNELLDFLYGMEREKGTFLEDDIITDIIREKIQEKEKQGKKTVLIIEDLDRLDPAHMFRLLNIFSAHDDFETKENKFGFSKVMFVCDLDNVEKIYRHFYGPATDFEGYMNKFYDTTPYRFRNYEAVSNYVDRMLFDCYPSETKCRSLMHFVLWETMKALARSNKLRFRNVVKIEPGKLRSIECSSQNEGYEYKDFSLLPNYIINTSDKRYYCLPTVVSILDYLIPGSGKDADFFKDVACKVDMPGDYLSSLNFEREVYGMEFEDIQEKFLTTDMIRFYIDRESLNTKQFRLIEALDEVKSKMKFE